jgi:hypothetical protein
MRNFDFDSQPSQVSGCAKPSKMENSLPGTEKQGTGKEKKGY